MSSCQDRAKLTFSSHAEAGDAGVCLAPADHTKRLQGASGDEPSRVGGGAGCPESSILSLAFPDQAGDSRLLSDEQEVAEFVSILICR